MRELCSSQRKSRLVLARPIQKSGLRGCISRDAQQHHMTRLSVSNMIINACHRHDLQSLTSCGLFSIVGISRLLAVRATPLQFDGCEREMRGNRSIIMIQRRQGNRGGVETPLGNSRQFLFRMYPANRVIGWKRSSVVERERSSLSVW